MELVVSTYGGDEILGCGILMMRRPKDFFVVVVSASAFQYSDEFPDIRGIDLVLWKKAETVRALKAIGVDSIKFLGHLTIYKKEVMEDLIRLNRRLKPSVIYFPHINSENLDRNRVAKVCMDLRTDATKVMYQCSDIEADSPSHTIKIGNVEREIKNRLIQVHRSQKRFLQSEYKKGIYAHYEYFWKVE